MKEQETLGVYCALSLLIPAALEITCATYEDTLWCCTPCTHTARMHWPSVILQAWPGSTNHILVILLTWISWTSGCGSCSTIPPHSVQPNASCDLPVPILTWTLCTPALTHEVALILSATLAGGVIPAFSMSVDQFWYSGQVDINHTLSLRSELQPCRVATLTNVPFFGNYRQT